MIEGTLTITLDPPTVSFYNGHTHSVKHCGMEDARLALLELGADSSVMQDCTARLKGSFRKALLIQLGVLPHLVRTDEPGIIRPVHAQRRQRRYS